MIAFRQQSAHSLSMSTIPILPIPEQIHGVSIICRREGRFLLVERGKEPLKGYLAFPGGSVEPGETATEAALRELLEETALTAQRLEHFITLDLARETRAYAKSYFLSVFRAFDINGIAQAGDDAVALKWLTVEEMPLYRVTESTLDIARSVAAREDGRR